MMDIDAGSKRRRLSAASEVDKNKYALAIPERALAPESPGRRPPPNLPPGLDAPDTTKLELDTEQEEVKELLAYDVSELKETLVDARATLRSRGERLDQLKKDIQESKDADAMMNTSSRPIDEEEKRHREFLQQLARLEGEEKATIERHNRNMNMLKRDLKRDVEALHKTTATLKRDIIQAKISLGQLQDAQETAQQSAQELLQLQEDEKIWG